MLDIVKATSHRRGRARRCILSPGACRCVHLACSAGVTRASMRFRAHHDEAHCAPSATSTRLPGSRRAASTSATTPGGGSGCPSPAQHPSSPSTAWSCCCWWCSFFCCGGGCSPAAQCGCSSPAAPRAACASSGVGGSWGASPRPSLERWESRIKSPVAHPLVTDCYRGPVPVGLFSYRDQGYVVQLCATGARLHSTVFALRSWHRLCQLSRYPLGGPA